MSENSVTPPDDDMDCDQQLEAVIADYKPALLDAIVADASISEPVRQLALELVSDWPE